MITKTFFKHKELHNLPLPNEPTSPKHATNSPLIMN